MLKVNLETSAMRDKLGVKDQQEQSDFPFFLSVEISLFLSIVLPHAPLLVWICVITQLIRLS